ncbi:MAG: 3-oxoacyl-ACP reductase, partial [Rhodobiaceae bacterium]|nr:3-oxoacyl-ACP reductase [Rhodobiaceae bacterium]
MDLGLNNKIVLVTAASQGLGKASALSIANEGAKVIICSRDEEKISKSAKEIKKQTGSEVSFFQADLSDKEDIDKMVEDIIKNYGRIDVLINNTGGPKAGFFDEISDDDWISTFESTFLSAVRLTRAVLPSMKRNKWGRIINISSVSAKQPIDNLMLSNGVRMSVHGWAKTLSNQIASDNILINNVCPGFTKTERVEDLVSIQAKELNISEE